MCVPLLLLPALVNVDGLPRPRPRPGLLSPGLLVDDDDAVVPGLGLGRPQRDVLREVGAQTQVITRLAVFFGLENVETLDGKTFNSHERKWSRPSFTQLTTFQFHVYNSTQNVITTQLPGSCRRGCGWRGPPWPPAPSACCSSRSPHRPWVAPPRLYCPQILDITVDIMSNISNISVLGLLCCHGFLSLASISSFMFRTAQGCRGFLSRALGVLLMISTTYHARCHLWCCMCAAPSLSPILDMREPCTCSVIEATRQHRRAASCMPGPC